MKHIEKVANYFEAYTTSGNKDAMIKIASEDGVTPDELVAFHNLTQGNVFTGENLIKVASDNPDSKIIALGMAFDKLASEEDFTVDDLYAYAENELGMDREDVDFVYSNLEKQAEAAGIVDDNNGNNNDNEANQNSDIPEELVEKIAEAMDYLDEAGINPIDGLFIGANLGEDNLIADEKIASEAAEAGFEVEDLQKIAEVAEYLGGIDENILGIAEQIAANIEE